VRRVRISEQVLEIDTALFRRVMGRFASGSRSSPLKPKAKFAA
jgi:hypothetical protein